MPNPRQVSTQPCASCGHHFLHSHGCTAAPAGSKVSTSNPTPSQTVARKVFTLDPIPDN